MPIIEQNIHMKLSGEKRRIRKTQEPKSTNLSHVNRFRDYETKLRDWKHRISASPHVSSAQKQGKRRRIAIKLPHD